MSCACLPVAGQGRREERELRCFDSLDEPQFHELSKLQTLTPLGLTPSGRVTDDASSSRACLPTSHIIVASLKKHCLSVPAQSNTSKPPRTRAAYTLRRHTKGYVHKTRRTSRVLVQAHNRLRRGGLSTQWALRIGLAPSHDALPAKQVATRGCRRIISRRHAQGAAAVGPRKEGRIGRCSL